MAAATQERVGRNEPSLIFTDRWFPHRPVLLARVRASRCSSLDPGARSPRRAGRVLVPGAVLGERPAPPCP